MKHAELGQIVRLDGQLMEVISIGTGRTVHMMPVDRKPCILCGYNDEAALLEHSQLFQDGVKPVKTVEDS